MFLSRDDESHNFSDKLENQNSESLFIYSNEVNNHCYNDLWFLVTFALTLGAYWNADKIRKFGVD